jgi:hypothetical protein
MKYRPVCSEWLNTIGNLHILRFEDNRRRQDKSAASSFSKEEREAAWLYSDGEDLSPEFSLEAVDVKGEENPAESRRKVLNFVCAARTRLLNLYGEWHEKLGIEVLLKEQDQNTST